VAVALATSTARASNDDRLIVGETTEIAGGTATTWARVNGAGNVIWVGLTIPLSMVENMPAVRGLGPAGAVVVLNFPQVVQESTYFNHVEIHSNPSGHPSNPEYADPNRYAVPHFDFHFYNIPVTDVMLIPPGSYSAQVPADRLPVGYAQPDANSVPQMGRHAAQLSEFTATDTWQFSMPAGFLPDASLMHFIEPMITQEFLLRQQNFSLPVPMPAVLGQPTNYPTECVVCYDEEADAYHIVFKGFEPIE
jgi:hypothetical protein